MSDTDTDESGVLVKAPSDSSDLDSSSPPELLVDSEQDYTLNSGEAYQIFSIGSEDDKYAFQYHEDKLHSIIKDIPKDCKVAIVSVVGAFRTGKSFLLSWFLRYLNYLRFQGSEGKVSSHSTSPWYEKLNSLGNDGFEWKGGSERNTTGVWMWSTPHFIQKSDGNGLLAVLLVDTQGMFDNETTMALTASIFGISTLLSSYQIYNVDKRIQEDNLQQLALFSEYARMAVEVEESDRSKSMESIQTSFSIDESDIKKFPTSKRQPFQRIEFLVRDWQHFDEDDPDNFELMEKSMDDYLCKVLGDRDARDLQETREQILSCFNQVTCYGLNHPGIPVTKKNFTGEVKAIDPQFLQLLDRYCKRVFDPTVIEPKVIHDRELTADELAVYVKAYAGLFASGASFPTAATMLDATASANNTNALRMAIEAYKDDMNQVAGPKCLDHLSNIELEREHMKCFLRSQRVFDSIANFGSKRSIEEARALFIQQIESDFDVYKSLNESRNPLAGWETYGVPAIIACVSAVLRWIADTTCSTQVCRTTSDFLSHTHATGWFFLIILGLTKFQKIKEASLRAKDTVEFIMNSGAQKKKSKTD